MSWFRKFIPRTINLISFKKKEVPEGLWTQCPQCQAVLFSPELVQKLYVCGHCHHHLPYPVKDRFAQLFDQIGSDIGESLLPYDKYHFKDTKRYKDRLKDVSAKTASTEALVVKTGMIEQQEVVLAIFDFDFIGGSMGTVVGARFVLAVQEALKRSIPLICIASSGGARMQESLFSLMQMAKTATALEMLAQARLPYIVVLASPCMGGVSASLAMLGDVILAEQNALVGFAGPRVIQQTIRKQLPEGFQRAESLLKYGAIDQVVHRKDLKKNLVLFLKSFMAHRVAG